MKFPACENLLREKNAGDAALDVCYGGCGGIWPAMEMIATLKENAGPAAPGTSPDA